MKNLTLDDGENPPVFLFYRMSNGFGDNFYTVAEGHGNDWNVIKLDKLVGDEPKHNDIVTLKSGTGTAYRIKQCPKCNILHTHAAAMHPRSDEGYCPRCTFDRSLGVAEEYVNESQ